MLISLESSLEFIGFSMLGVDRWASGASFPEWPRPLPVWPRPLPFPASEASVGDFISFSSSDTSSCSKSAVLDFF